MEPIPGPTLVCGYVELEPTIHEDLYCFADAMVAMLEIHPLALPFQVMPPPRRVPPCMPFFPRPGNMDSHTGPNMKLPVIIMPMDVVHDPVDALFNLHQGGNVDPFHAEIAHLVANRMIAQFYDRNVRWDSEITLHPTFLSWLKNLNTLSTLINRLSELAAAAPQEYQLQLNHQVAALRAGFKKQQERCISFLQLVGEYAYRFLSDIAEEILQQSSFLDALKRRLDMAKTLCHEVVKLRKSYELGTLDCIKKVRRTGTCLLRYHVVAL